MVITLDETKENRAKIKVIGVGGAGGNALNRMIESGLHGVEFIAINTDAMALENNLAERKISIGQKLCKGLGAGSRPDKGFEAIQEDRKLVEEALSGADMVFIAGGMGGGTGTGAAPVVAEISRELGILTVGVVTEPFNWEGPIRKRHSKKGLNNLTSNVDTIIAIQNQKIFDVIPKNTTVLDAYKTVDGVLMDAVKGISDIILNHGFMQVDFADVREIMNNGGEALIGTGIAEGEGKAQLAAELAIHSPLLENISISGAGGILVNITGGDELAMHEINDVMTYIYDMVGEENEPHIIFGNVIDSSMGERVAVTVIATGFTNGKVTEKTTDVQGVVAPQVTPGLEPQVVEPVQEESRIPQTIEPIISKEEVDALQEVHTTEAPIAPELTIDASIPKMNPEFEESFFGSASNDERPSFLRMNEESSSIDVRSQEVEETIVAEPQEMSDYCSELQKDNEQISHVVRPTQRIQELNRGMIDDGVDYSKPAFQRIGGLKSVDSKMTESEDLYSQENSKVDERPAFLRFQD
ncbi:MAG: cell division protein FtsZ [Fibrobacterales bacterium]